MKIQQMKQWSGRKMYRTSKLPYSLVSWLFLNLNLGRYKFLDSVCITLEFHIISCQWLTIMGLVSVCPLFRKRKHPIDHL
jgi:hypothetical protein